MHSFGAMTTQATETRPDSNGLTWRSLSAADIEPWFDLIATIEAHDREQERTRRADLETLARQSWVDLAADTSEGVDADGTYPDSIVGGCTPRVGEVLQALQRGRHHLG